MATSFCDLLSTCTFTNYSHGFNIMEFLYKLPCFIRVTVWNVTRHPTIYNSDSEMLHLLVSKGAYLYFLSDSLTIHYSNVLLCMTIAWIRLNMSMGDGVELGGPCRPSPCLMLPGLASTLQIPHLWWISQTRPLVAFPVRLNPLPRVRVKVRRKYEMLIEKDFDSEG